MPATLNSVLKAYQNTIGKRVNKQKLSEKLSEAEKIGITEKKIANRQDEPVQMWRTECSL